MTTMLKTEISEDRWFSRTELPSFFWLPHRPALRDSGWSLEMGLSVSAQLTFGARCFLWWGAVLDFAECLAASLNLLSRWQQHPPSPVIRNNNVSRHDVPWETRLPLAKNHWSGRKKLLKKRITNIKKGKRRGKELMSKAMGRTLTGSAAERLLPVFPRMCWVS